jgi:hypothetical protein
MHNNAVGEFKHRVTKSLRSAAEFMVDQQNLMQVRLRDELQAELDELAALHIDFNAEEDYECCLVSEYRPDVMTIGFGMLPTLANELPRTGKASSGKKPSKRQTDISYPFTNLLLAKKQQEEEARNKRFKDKAFQELAAFDEDN